MPSNDSYAGLVLAASDRIREIGGLPKKTSSWVNPTPKERS